jgi:Na+-transporting methylmalonyl-CoA/oxaloacetate decarboxylase beta subunit
MKAIAANWSYCKLVTLGLPPIWKRKQADKTRQIRNKAAKVKESNFFILFVFNCEIQNYEHVC